MQYIKKHINLFTKIIIIIIFAIIFFNMNKCYMYMDDEVYAKVFNSFSTFKTWAIEFYNIWSGRIVTSALSNIFLRMPLIIFRICNTLVYIMGIMAILEIIKCFAKVNNAKTENILLFILFLLSFIIDENVIKMGALWVTGSFNYLWPMAFMFVALIPFIKEFNDIQYSKRCYILYILADFIACFAEQPTLILATIGTIVVFYIIFSKKKLNRLLILHYIVILLLTTIEMTAPGNFVRYTASTLRRYPTFDMLNIGDKLLQGMIVISNQLLSYDNILMIILTFLIGIRNSKAEDKKIKYKLFSTIPFLYFIISYIFGKLEIGEGTLYNLILFGKEYLYGIKIYIPIFIFILNLILVACLILFSFDNEKKGIFTTLIFLGGIASSLTIGMSPTIYASGERTFLTMDFMILIVIGIYIEDLWSRLHKEKISN